MTEPQHKDKDGNLIEGWLSYSFAEDDRITKWLLYKDGVVVGACRLGGNLKWSMYLPGTMHGYKTAEECKLEIERAQQEPAKGSVHFYSGRAKGFTDEDDGWYYRPMNYPHKGESGPFMSFKEAEKYAANPW